MPFYEYECSNCRFYSEVMQRITDPPLRKCPSCGKNTMTKLVSAPNFRLKGGGWYETDFKSDQETKRNLAVDKEPEPAKESKEAASDTGKAEAAKPAAEKAATASAPARPAKVSPPRKAATRTASRPHQRKPAPKSKPKPRAAARRGRR